jgi:hypothetical protein
LREFEWWPATRKLGDGVGTYKAPTRVLPQVRLDKQQAEGEAGKQAKAQRIALYGTALCERIRHKEKPSFPRIVQLNGHHTVMEEGLQDVAVRERHNANYR